MRTYLRNALACAATVLTLGGGLALMDSPLASASPKSMNINATGGDGTTVDRDGTQGSFTDAVQGTIDSDGDQDAFDVIKSEEASPQEKSPNKMTK